MQAEEMMEKKIASAMEVCKKYNRIKADGKKAEEVWKYNLDMAADVDLCQYFEHKKLKGYADFFNSSSSFCCGVI